VYGVYGTFSAIFVEIETAAATVVPKRDVSAPVGVHVPLPVSTLHLTPCPHAGVHRR
jgi:hypothetical protein